MEVVKCSSSITSQRVNIEYELSINEQESKLNFKIIKLEIMGKDICIWSKYAEFSIVDERFSDPIEDISDISVIVTNVESESDTDYVIEIQLKGAVIKRLKFYHTTNNNGGIYKYESYSINSNSEIIDHSLTVGLISAGRTICNFNTIDTLIRNNINIKI